MASSGNSGGEAARAAAGGRGPGWDAAFAGSLACWAGLSAYSLLYVLMVGTIVPFQDDVEFIGGMSGDGPPDWRWLFGAHNEHVFPIARALMLGAARATNLDFRYFYLINFGLISGGSLLLLAASARSRGRGSWFDALIPLYGVSLLQFWNLTHATNLSFALYLFLFAAVAAGALLDFSRSAAGIVLVGAAVAALSATGAYGLAGGLVLVPFVALFGLLSLASGEAGARRRGALLLAAAATGGAVAFPYLIFVLTRTSHEEAESAAAVIVCWLRVAAMMSGRAWRVVDPGESGLQRAVLPGLLVFALGAGLWGMRIAGRARRVSLGLLMSLLGVLAVCGAVGLGRANVGAAIPLWYITLATPVAWSLYLLADRNGGFAGRAGVGIALATLGVMGVAKTSSYAWQKGWERKAASARFTRDARAGLSPTELNARYQQDFYRWAGEKSMAPALEAMRRHGEGPFGAGREAWLEVPGFLMVERRVDLVDDEDGRVRVVAAEGGQVEAVGRGVVLTVGRRETIFLLPVGDGAGRSGRMIQVELLSPYAARASLGTEGGAMHDAEVRPGANLLTFVLDPGTTEEVVRFTPGAEAGRYRLRSVRVFDLP